MVEEETVRIIEDIKEIKREEIPDEEVIEEEELQEELKEELDLIENESSAGENFAPLLEADDIPQGEQRSFSLDDLKDVDVPSKKKNKKAKKEELYSSKKAEDFYAGGSSPNDLYQGISPEQGPATTDFYEQSSLDSFYNMDSSGEQFYTIPSELDDEQESDRIETHSTLENKFKDQKKDDLMFRS